jgi:predicted flap endonuclease-1-like 5' DNA nuclease
MSNYLPVIISAVLIIAILLWWLLALDGVKKKTDSAPEDNVSPPAAVPAPPVAPVADASPKLMDDPAPAKAAKAKADKAPKVKVEKAKAEKAPKAKAPKAAPVSSIPDNLELIKGLGPKVNKLLKDLGVTSFAQVASWTVADVADMDSKLGAFAGRITRDNWVDQAQLLAAGDIAGFEQKYGALGKAAKG